MDETLATQLIDMAEADRRLRDLLARDGTLFDGYHPAMRALHEQNARRLADIVARVGWPGRNLVGPDASKAAWLIAQHAISRPDLQRKWLLLLQRAAARGEVRAAEPAYLLDRIRMMEGRPQIYGTQFDWTAAGRLEPHPIEAEPEVDRRRATVGLEPMAEMVGRMRQAAAQELPAADWQRRRTDMESFAQEVGWRGEQPAFGR